MNAAEYWCPSTKIVSMIDSYTGRRTLKPAIPLKPAKVYLRTKKIPKDQRYPNIVVLHSILSSLNKKVLKLLISESKNKFF